MAKTYQKANRKTIPHRVNDKQLKIEDSATSKAKTLKNAILLDLPAVFTMSKVMASSLKYAYGGILNKELTTERQLVLDDTWHIGSTGDMGKMRYGQWEEAEHAGTRTILPAFQIESIIEMKDPELK